MKKYLVVLAALILSLNCAYAGPVNGSISRDYDFGFESIIKRKFKEILKISKIFEKNDDTFYNKGYRPLYMLSMKELYSVTPTVKSNIEKRQIPNTYNLSFSGDSETAETDISFEPSNTINKDLTTELIEKQEEFYKVQNDYRKMLALNPDRIEVLYKYAQFLYANGKYDASIAVLNDIINKDSNFVLASFTLANIYFDMGQYKNSIKANLNVIKKNPYCADAYYNIASALEKMHKFHLAIDYYQKCLSINQNDAQAQNALKRLEQLTYNK